MTKILFTCPQAHYAGHHVRAATLEPDFLRSGGNEVDLLTFCGIMGEPLVVFYVIVYRGSLFGLLYAKLRKKTFMRWLLMAIENFRTQYDAAVRCKKSGAILHLRDGEPFLIIPPIISLLFPSVRWCISMTGSVMYAPKVEQKGLSAWVYRSVLNLMGGRLSRFLYKPTVKRMMFTCQNKKTASDLEQFMGGVFKGRVHTIPLTVGEKREKLPMREAREKLNLPKDAFIVLSWGAPHQGKDIETVFNAVSRLEGDVLLLHGGKHSFSLGNNMPALAEKYHVNLRMNNEYIPEELKPVYFDAADVIVMSYTKEFKSSSSVLVEAVLFGIPLIASDSEAIAADVNQYGLGRLFRTGDPDSLLNQLKDARTKVYTNGCNREAYLQLHGVKAFAEGYNKVYEALK